MSMYTIREHEGTHFVEYNNDSVGLTLFTTADKDSAKGFKKAMESFGVVVRNGNLNDQLIKVALLNVPVYHNDLSSELWSYDFKHDDKWVENIEWSNDLKTVTVTITQQDKGEA